MRKLTFAGGAMASLGAMTHLERARGRYMRGPDGHEQKTVEQLANETKAAFEKKHDEVKEIAEKALAEAEKGIPLSTTAKELADQALTGMNEAKARLDELEQKMASRSGAEERRERSIGEQYVESDEYKSAFANGARQGQNVGIEVKAITSLTTNADGSAGDAVRPGSHPGAHGHAARSSDDRA
jgi:Asp-tRNA(Asn)/Glu-tRNA(Gln) amidotransferase A subunit family amidase